MDQRRRAVNSLSPRQVDPSPLGSDSYEESPILSSRPASPPPVLTTLTSGPFSGISLPFASARANAVHVVREHVSTYLITHPHLDHVSGFVINTAAFHNTSRPKRLAALPFAVNAIKTHIFNDVIWPNLTDEDGGVGLVTFQRLAEGGNIALGEGPGKGFIEVCDGLSTKAFKVSHGHCMRGPGHIHRGSMPETPGGALSHQLPIIHTTGYGTGINGPENRSHSFSTVTSQPGTPLYTGSIQVPTEAPHQFQQCVIDSTAYFIRAEPGPGQSSSHAREVLIFGDVEPDAISLSPRTALVWAEAAPKIAASILRGIFIECSYNDSQNDAVLFGHLAPRHLIAELQNLADMVREARRELEREREEHRNDRKRKRLSNTSIFRDGTLTPGGISDMDEKARTRSSRSRRRGTTEDRKRTSRSSGDEPMHDYTEARSPAQRLSTSISRPSAPAILDPLVTTSSEYTKGFLAAQEAPLKGVKIVIIHVKDTMVDGLPVGESIQQQLEEYESDLQLTGRGLGCEFIISKSGQSYYF